MLVQCESDNACPLRPDVIEIQHEDVALATVDALRPLQVVDEEAQVAAAEGTVERVQLVEMCSPGSGTLSGAPTVTADAYQFTLRHLGPHALECVTLVHELGHVGLLRVQMIELEHQWVFEQTVRTAAVSDDVEDELPGLQAPPLPRRLRLASVELTTVVHVPPPTGLAPALPAALGMVEARDGSSHAAATAESRALREDLRRLVRDVGRRSGSGDVPGPNARGRHRDTQLLSDLTKRQALLAKRSGSRTRRWFSECHDEHMFVQSSDERSPCPRASRPSGA
jgi:hypothetical protein